MAKLVLCKGVELEPNYEHTFDFENSTQQEGYFNSKAYKTYDEFLFIKDRNASLFKGIIAKENYDYVKVDESIDKVRECTYMFWQNNPDAVNPSKTYYAFITNSYYINEGCTVIEFEMDVMQTFLFDFQIESAYIAREHQDRMEATSSTPSTHTYKRKFNIQPENLNLGSDYIINGNQKLCKYATFTEDGQTIKRPVVWIIVIATDPLVTDYQSFYQMNNNLYVYAIPFVIDKSFNSSVSINSLSIDDNGTNRTLWSYQTLIAQWSNDTTLPKIHQIVVTSYLPDYDGISIDSNNVIHLTTNSKKLWEIKQATILGNDGYLLKLFQNPSYVEKDKASILGEIKDINDEIFIGSPSSTLENNINYESKLKTYPYSYIQMTHNNQFMELKYENIKSKIIEGKINIYGAYSFLVYNRNYAMKNNALVDNDDLGYNYGIASKAINDLPLTSDAYLTYMLTRSAQAVTGASVKAIGGLLSGVGGVIGLASATTPMGMVAAAGMLATGLLTSGGAIADLVAKEEDLKSTPPSIENMSNDGTFAVESKTIIPILQYMEIKEEYKQQCYGYFRLFGYKANRLATPTYDELGTIVDDNMRLKSRYYYNYIKCADININLAYNRDYHDKIIAIFKSGITFWHFRTGMQYSTFGPFNYRYENIETSLL